DRLAGLHGHGARHRAPVGMLEGEDVAADGELDAGERRLAELAAAEVDDAVRLRARREVADAGAAAAAAARLLLEHDLDGAVLAGGEVDGARRRRVPVLGDDDRDGARRAIAQDERRRSRARAVDGGARAG